MSVEKNKANIRRHVEEVWNKGNLDLIPELIAPNYVAHTISGTDVKGPEGFKQQIVVATRTALPDVHYTIDSLVAEGDLVAARYIATGTFTGEVAGFKPTGKKVSLKSAVFHRFENGKQVEAWSYSDSLDQSRQLGIPLPKE
jgi:predicted ester cyclase